MYCGTETVTTHSWLTLAIVSDDNMFVLF